MTSAQALADYALLVRTLKADEGAESSPVIAFGGSYGGQVGTTALHFRVYGQEILRRV